METLSWEAFEKHLYGLSPSILNMGGTRNVRVGFDPISRSMFIRLPIDPETSVPPSTFAELESGVLKDETGFVLEIKTTAKQLFREFHRFAEIITEDFEQPGQTAFGAFETATHRWRELTSRKELLTEDQQLGLQGELVFLRSLLQVQRPQSIMAWTGRNKALAERHDFRINKIDIEVKSTRSSHRRHIIHGIGQLQASEGHILYLLSLKFEGAGLGLGRSLCDEIEGIRKSLANTEIERMEFESRLLSTGYNDNDAQHYQEKLILADPPVLVIVNDKFPRITREIMSETISPEVSGRIDDVSYRVDIEGLGVMQGSEAFTDVLGKLRMEIE
ncbi:MAG: hypothetical protein A2X25_09040 [Chloroflexi bacterium GWB2_49_20]|nr:MAG: hypothetical protein A2X25_09040 [Chloroflexi bacterium GWB2_49_20]OGN79422.1 MAG: hypothetical protein A2X26_04985 [Chloroflexi bacterium GWC2_49_37]OGN82809.1 MAG: hypothetical protein A2X27_07710 [Chloroflexi bacterium GWD2_49_16]HCC79708.1 hypothetical protein [Anaerolineae bacterium]HCM97280.1 hypothetical protein [Anaerolineae bacterium]